MTTPADHEYIDPLDLRGDELLVEMQARGIDFGHSNCTELLQQAVVQGEAVTDIIQHSRNQELAELRTKTEEINRDLDLPVVAGHWNSVRAALSRLIHLLHRSQRLVHTKPKCEASQKVSTQIEETLQKARDILQSIAQPEATHVTCKPSESNVEEMPTRDARTSAQESNPATGQLNQPFGPEDWQNQPRDELVTLFNIHSIQCSSFSATNHEPKWSPALADNL